ncbi:alpha/beta fold hydrolase [Bailinhaonella thermotolerans]|uniref:Alpha/beta hydrolase n=1 Tax=Bailinhaonella thermotolerans TaxID=1070861 RepID=A0A3A4B5A1_9ACTN|nr:alpha/beta hydrolase [Bailinhaonella thermotolerans]RJL32592.1 alpha/beta hydrolase [Bailinhaonella thermotolerans]
MVERIVRANGVRICLETFGRADYPAILLIMGAAGSMDWWDDAFCARLATESRFVIRYDNRDTGRSVAYPPGAPPYTMADLAGDAVGVLDALGLERAHFAGISMGAWIALIAALTRPERVASLTVMSASPGPGDPDLPPPAPRVSALLSSDDPGPDWSDRAAVIDYYAGTQRLFAGEPYDEALVRRTVARAYDRSSSPASWNNHYLIAGGGAGRANLPEIKAPTLVMHGTEDPLFPFAHGEAMAREIPSAELLPLPHTGHEAPPEPSWPIAIPALLRHTAPNRALS